MTTKKNLVKQVLMSTLTAGIFAFSFSSCSDDLELDQAPVNPETELSNQTRAGSSDYNINHYKVIYGSKKQIAEPFKTKNWQNEEAIFCYVGKDKGDDDIFDDNGNKLSGYTVVNLPWSDQPSSNNIPDRILKDLMASPTGSSEDNPWKLVLMNCGAENVENGNFLGFYNQLTGVLRMLVYIPKDVVAEGNTHMWGVLMNDDMANRSIFRYGVPNDKNITSSDAKKALSQSGEMAQIISPWKKGSFNGFNGSPLSPGWWAFDMDFSLYRDNDNDKHFTLLRDNEDVLTFKALSKTDESLNMQSKMLAKLEGSLNLEATQASTSSGIFAPLENVLGKGNDIADLVEIAQNAVNPNPLKAIENGIKLAKGACNLAGIDYGAETTGFDGYKGTMNLALDGSIDTKGVITKQENVAGILPISFKKGDFIMDNCPTFGQGIWNLEQAPLVYITNAYTYWRFTHVCWEEGVVEALYTNKKSPFGGQYVKEVNCHNEEVTSAVSEKDPYAGYVSYFDPSSIKLKLNDKVFTPYEIEHAKVYATCGLRKGMDFGSTEPYRAAQGLEKSQYNFTSNYGYANRCIDEAPFDGLSGSDNKMGMKTGAKFETSKYDGIYYGAFGCGDDDYIVNAQSLKSNRSGQHMMPALEVTVTVVVTNELGRKLVYTRTYLPEYKKIDVTKIPALNKDNFADGCQPNYDRQIYVQQRKHIKDIRDWALHSLHPLYGTTLAANHMVGYLSIGYDFDKSSEAYPNLIDGDVKTKWCSTRDIMKRAVDTRCQFYMLGNYYDDSKYFSDRRKVWYIEFESNFPISPKGYSLVTANDNTTYGHRCPRTWAVYGKRNFNDDWTLLTNVETAVAGGRPNSYALPGGNYAEKSYTFNKVNPKDMKYFRFEIANTWSDDDDNCMQLSEFRFNFDD